MCRHTAQNSIWKRASIPTSIELMDTTTSMRKSTHTAMTVHTVMAANTATVTSTSKTFTNDLLCL